MADEKENIPNNADPLNLAEEAAAAAERTVEQDLAELGRQVSELQAKLLRAHADYQNLARRSQQNVIAAKDQQVGDMARDLLPVIDHFDTALAVDPSKATAKSLLDGLVMVRDELMRSLARHGIARITASQGDEFDPNIHEALMRVKAPGVATNQVVTQLQPGYVLGDRTLRPVKVSVAE
jgi:molecular chaperone GrpE